MTELCCSEIELISPLFRSLSAEQKATLRGNATTVEEIVVTSSGRVLRKLQARKLFCEGPRFTPRSMVGRSSGLGGAGKAFRECVSILRAVTVTMSNTPQIGQMRVWHLFSQNSAVSRVAPAFGRVMLDSVFT